MLHVTYTLVLNGTFRGGAASFALGLRVQVKGNFERP